MKKQETIVYVNFCPYENTGKILDYLVENFKNVIVFSFKFHKLDRNFETSRLKIYKDGKLKDNYKLLHFPIPEILNFLLLPIRSIVISLEIVLCLLFLKKRFQKYDIYFTVNAFTAFTGNILRKFGVVNKTIFWVWDYYPPIHSNKIISFMRWIYWHFDKTTIKCDKLVFLNKRLEELRKDIGILPKNAQFSTVPIGTNPIEFKRKKKGNITLGFIGVLKKNQGLDLIFDNAKIIKEKFPNIVLEIIGAGPDKAYFEKRAKEGFPCRFYGSLEISSIPARNILRKFDIGIATYIPEEGNVSYYGDPSKIKDYLSFGIPIITTNVFSFSDEIKKSKAGVIIDYYKKYKLINAISLILKHRDKYSSNAFKLAKRYNYKNIYSKMFNV